jgi:hypothetical protein
VDNLQLAISAAVLLLITGIGLYNEALVVPIMTGILASGFLFFGTLLLLIRFAPAKRLLVQLMIAVIPRHHLNRLAARQGVSK